MKVNHAASVVKNIKNNGIKDIYNTLHGKDATFRSKELN